MPGSPMERVFTAGVFDGPLRDLIHAFKYRGRDYLSHPLGKFWLKRTLFRPDEIDLIVPVPMPFWKKWRRGYNQAFLVADEIARVWNKPLADSLLGRFNRSPSQTILNRRRRFQNADASFYMRRKKLDLNQRTILLIDDVCTTGATFTACARLLKSAGARRVYAGAVARELLK